MSISAVSEAVLVEMGFIGEDEVNNTVTVLKKEDRLVLTDYSLVSGKEYLIEIEVTEIE